MTNTEAIEILSRPFDMENVPQDILEAHRMAIAALEKQELQKPIDKRGWPKSGRDTADGLCPVCGSPLVCTTPRYYSKHEYYCRDCGQRIDWSDEAAWGRYLKEEN